MKNEDELILNKNNEEKIKQFLSIYSVDLRSLADELFDYYVLNVSNKKMNNIYFIEYDDLRNLLMILGIKKNDYDLRIIVERLKTTNPKSFYFEDKYTKINFIDIVEMFSNYRIDEKVIVEVFNEIDIDRDGYINFNEIKNNNTDTENKK